MKTVDHQDWMAANQRYLMAQLAVVADAIERPHPSGADEGGVADRAPQREDALADAPLAMPAPAALDTVCQLFSLSSFERGLLLMCAGVELDSRFAALCASRNAAGRPAPTFSLALAALPDAHWSATVPTGPLRRWRLIEVGGGGDALTTSPLKIDERVLHYLAGISYIDDRLHGVLMFQPPPPHLAPSHRTVARRIWEAWARQRPGGAPVVHLAGEDGDGMRAVAAAACAALELQLQVLSAGELPVHAAERERLARLSEREALLTGSALLLEADDAETHRAAARFLEHACCHVLYASARPLRLRNRPVLRLEVDMPTAAEQVGLWSDALGRAASSLEEHVDVLAAQFSLAAGEIAEVTAQAASNGAMTPEEQARQLWDVCRQRARGRLDDLAQRIDPLGSWGELVLPAAQLQTLREIAVHVRHRRRVYDTWGFASKGTRGLGISALFAGPSGTGKTMAAEVLARDLRLDLYRIDLSQVVSKYIGETEKNLRRVFDAAEAGGAVLLFDEADALFGKRSEVRDSHDRYANIEVSYLLQRMESYRGLAILTTNMKSALDSAFLRRLRFIVEFPFPDTAQRAEIWRRVYPERTPVEMLDIGKLARLNVAGGHIRNIAMHAAFIAAESGEPVRMTHLLRAARSEFAKLEKPLGDGECRDWV
jgi:ATPase family associated with various cellular activities (AAA)